MEILKNMTEAEWILSLIVAGLLFIKLNPRKPTWKRYLKQKPPEGVEVLAYHQDWEDKDFNPLGIRIGFLNADGFTSAMWWDYQDTYMTISPDIIGDDAFSARVQWSVEPQKWIELDSLTGSLKDYIQIKYFA